VTVADGAMSLTFGLTQLASTWETISNPDATGWEKLQAVMMAMSMGLPQLLGGLNSLGVGFAKLAASTLLNATITKTDSGVQVEAGASKLGHAASARVLEFA